MLIKGNALDAFLARPPADLRGFLFFGPNEGRVRESAAIAAKSVVPDLSDPFRVCHLTLADLKADPARLADEAAAIAMTGGRRVVRVTGIGDAQSESFTNFHENPMGDALIVAEAGELPRASRLRKLFESSKLFAIMACYEETAADLDRLVVDHLRRQGLRITSDAKTYLLQCLGEDRLAVRQELDKLVLYKWPRPRGRAGGGTGDYYVLEGQESKAGRELHGVHDTVDTIGILDTPDIRHGFDGGGGYDRYDRTDAPGRGGDSGVQDTMDSRDAGDISDTRDAGGVFDTKSVSADQDSQPALISLDDVIACIGDSSVQGLNGICDAMGEGNVARLDSQIARAYEAALAPVAILRAASNHLMQLQLASARLSEGVDTDTAIRGLRPPPNYQRNRSFQQQLRLWNLARIARGLDLLLDGEAACKTSGAPDLSLCSRALLRTALLVRSSS